MTLDQQINGKDRSALCWTSHRHRSCSSYTFKEDIYTIGKGTCSAKIIHFEEQALLKTKSHENERDHLEVKI